MQIDITFRSMDASPAVEQAIRERAAQLDHVSHRVSRCEVVIEVPHRHHSHGQAYHVRLAVTVGDHVITVSHATSHDHAHTDVYVAIADAFHAALRQLRDHAAKRRDVKLHA